jgi:hypothetical protein
MSITRLPHSLFGLVLTTVLLAALCLPTSGSSAAPADPAARAGAGFAPLSVDISSLKGFFDTLSPDEKDEQLRDWALYGLKSALALGTSGEMPVRHPALTASHPGEISAGRVFPISATEWGLLVAPELLADKPLLGGLIDRKNATCNALPAKISLFTYTTDPSASAISIVGAGSVRAKDLFTPEYGYYSAMVTSLTDLNAFVANIDDLVSLSWHSGRLVLGGRKYLQESPRALTVEDVAALYQAYNVPHPDRKQLERMAREKYADLLRSDPGLQKALRRGSVKKAQVLARLRRQLAPPATENVGFSLDPKVDYSALAADIRKMTGPHTASLHNMDPALSALLLSHRGALNAAAARLESRRDTGPLLALRRRYEKSPHETEQRFASTLRFLEAQHAYQTSRYDGNLQGTGVGMILFYTDLLAKLWALDYQGIAPKGTVKGFRTMQEVLVPKLNWDDFIRLSNTRLWFGLRTDGFDVYGDKLLFQPAVTRVYAASSDPLYPGKESAPNYQSGAFLGWWDKHYEAVAAYEPYYHKLDQIQKWGCVFLVLKEKRSHSLDFLQSYPVQRNLDFATWQAYQPYLAKLGIPFLDRNKLGRSTECLPLLNSRGFQQMGKPYVLRGGVSLASRKDILAKLHQHGAGRAAAATEPAAAAAAGNAAHGAPGSAAHGGGPVARSSSDSKAAQGKSARQARAGHPEKARRQLAAGRAGESPAPSPGQAAGEGLTAERVTGATPTEPHTAGGTNGTFSAEKRSGAVKLKWQKGPSIAMHELVASLAALQQTDTRRFKGEAIFGSLGDVQSVVRLKQWSGYLVKTGASDDQWIYLGINPAKAADYPAQAAAAFPEADIFCARLVSGASAKKLAAGKPVVR